MCYAHLTQRERYQIEVLRQSKVRAALIARKLGVHRSTVYRELGRGAGVGGRYEAAPAQLAAERRLERLARRGHKPRPSIHDRPLEARDRRVPGHWEGDTMRGSSSQNDVVLALVERTSRLVRLRMCRPGAPLSDTVNQHIKQTLKGHPVRSLTFDNGSEFMRYEELQRDICPVFFCDPR
ncbi:MAG: IS30 family transposase, partial [Proteobacteria bacterium]|nr:IS30 family transposase [Pseudomonadota bacterium]